MTTDTTEAIAYLQSFISRTMRITTTDTRIFVGELKCADRDQNLILSRTHEYRLPKATHDNVGRKLDLTSRFLGLVVVMGVDIVRIDVEEVGKRRMQPSRNEDEGMDNGADGVGIGGWGSR